MSYLHLLKVEREKRESGDVSLAVNTASQVSVGGSLEGLGKEKVVEDCVVDSSEFNYVGFLRALFILFVKDQPQFVDGLPLVYFYGVYSMKVYGKERYGGFLSFGEFETKISVGGVFLIKDNGGVKEVFLRKEDGDKF